ncbi:MAG TPA: tRNA (adenosine(37)-N6)-dimethylallyltransferase MiaA [Spirochaetia bacterium]|nr:tRNA (adenosine(37)-N6)-dimethylallyltransferase MiaA [Spirochaetia bacterium]
MTNKKKQHIVIICGPTASGKTDLSLQLAKVLPKANMLSVDSRQVYKGLDIITGKDIPNNLSSKIKILGHNLFAPDEMANLAEFTRYSKKIIHDSNKTSTPLIIVGGTGLYLKAITQNLSDISIPRNPFIRQELEKLSLSELQNFLKKENPVKYQSLNRSDSMNPRRLIRYIEISRSKAPSPIKKTINISFQWVGLMPDKKTIIESIKKRVLQRIKTGALDEVKNLLINYPNRNLPIYTSLGVSQIIEYLEGKISKKKLIEIWTKAETDYARRQIVWFKKQPNIVWYDNSTDTSLLIDKLKNIYQQNA